MIFNIIQRPNELKEVTMYFDKSGKNNTDQTLISAAERAKQLGLKEVVVAELLIRPWKCLKVSA